MSKEQNGEKMILSHEPVPGYRMVFYVVCAVAALYLGGIFMRSVL